MDKVRKDGLATKKEVLSKVNELVKEYNDIREWIDENLQNYIKVLERITEVDNRLEEYVKEIKKHMKVIFDIINAIK